MPCGKQGEITSYCGCGSYMVYIPALEYHELAYEWDMVGWTICDTADKRDAIYAKRFLNTTCEGTNCPFGHGT
jgi:hypothetical protein